jgi:hypothetical protein
MKTLLLTSIAWLSKLPGSTVKEIYSAAADIVSKSDTTANLSGWEKLKRAVDYLVELVPADEKNKAIASTVVTIIVNVAVLVVRMKGAAK